ncbi:MAG: transglycosylase SLT domain-containing protein [bacterium]|nr:transglycosylase SLT domain-containing protein [bacterium]
MTVLPPMLTTLGWTLIHFVWQGALIALAYGPVRWSLRRSSPESRYALACVALCSMALLSACTFAVVWSSLPTGPAVGESPQPTGPLLAGQGDVWRAIVPQAMPWFLTLWGLGVGAFATRATVGWVALHRLVRRDSFALEPAWQERVDRLAAALGLQGGFRALATRRVTGPIVTGCWRPVALLPLSALTGLPPGQLESLILHELAHIKRRDHWVQRGQLVLETLFFYHPAVWWISRAVNHEREYCCDAAVVAITDDRLGYARALTSLASLDTRIPQQALAFNGGSLMSRIRSIVNPNPPSTPSLFLTAAGGLAAMGLVVALIATTSVIGGSTHAFVPSWMPESVERWSPQIERAANRHGVDAALISIMTLVESRGNPDAVSSWGARGLMQVMPATGVAIATERGIEDFDAKSLSDPEINVDFAAYYLAGLIGEFANEALSEESIARVAAAYNGGPKRMREYLEAGRALSRESERYSRIVSRLWSERNDATSATLDRMAANKDM